MFDKFNAILRCPHCGTMYKVAITKNGYKTDYNDHLRIIKGDNVNCMKCNKLFSVPDNRIISEDWIIDMIFKIKGH